jgi:serine/threonine protein kinase
MVILKMMYVHSDFGLMLYTDTSQSMVIKLVNYLPLWDRISAFSNDNRDIPREVAAHRTLWAAGDEEDDEERQLAQSYILGYRGYTLERPYKFYRIASDEAVLGTLDNVEDLFDVSKPQFRQRGEKLEEGFGDDDYEFMPVHFIARVWLAIVKGLMHMHKQGLVHRDLKPSNVFLTKISDDVDDPVMGRWGLKPWLGDFGAAVPKEPVRYENPTDFDDMWIPMFGAPEMHQGWPALVRKNKKGEPYPLDEKSDVFGLAVTIWSVMLVGYLNFKAGDLWEFDNNGNPKWKAEDTDHIWTWMGRVELDDVSAHALNDYWMQKDQPQTELMTLLAACLDISPAKRPSLAQLDELITAWIQNTPDPGPPSDNGGNDGDSEQSDEDQPLSRFEYWFGRLENTSNDTSGERTDTIADMAAKY